MNSPADKQSPASPAQNSPNEPPAEGVPSLPSIPATDTARVSFAEPEANGEVKREDEGDPEGGRCRPACHPNRPQKLTFSRKVIAASGHILNDICASLWFTYFLLYMKNVAGFGDRGAALLLLVGQLVDGLSTPLVGYEADRVNHCWLCKKGYGRCKSWHLLGVCLVLLSYPFVFSPCIGCTDATSEVAKGLYYGPFIAVFQIGWAASQISHLALVPKLSPDLLIRTEILAIRYAFTVASNIMVFLLAWVIIGFESSDADKHCKIDGADASKFQAIALIGIGVGGFFSILFHVFVVEKSDDEIRKAIQQQEDYNARRNSDNQNQRHHHKDFVESLQTITNVRSVASSMTISKVQAQARRRRSASISSKHSVDRDAGTALLSDQDEPAVEEQSEDLQSSGERTASPSHGAPSLGSIPSRLPTPTPQARERVTVAEWMMMPQFYIVALMYMATRINVNITQAYVPLFVQETLELECQAVATVPLTMFCSGFVISIFIKVINKYLGRQVAYGIGALLCVIAALLILLMDWSPNGVMATKGIYGIAVLLGGGASAILVTSLSITADMIGNNVDSGAFVYGAMSFCDKLSCGLAVMLINELKGFYTDQQFYQRVLGYTAAGSSVVGVFGTLALSFIIYRQTSPSNRTNTE